MLKNKILKKERIENMKKFRKVIVALLAMVMALGCLTMTASADDTKYYVVGSMQGWNLGESIEMTDAGNGVYTYTFDVADTTAVEFKIVTDQANWDTQISMGGGTNGGNFTYTPEAAGSLTITLDTAKIGAENAGDEAVTVAPTADSNTGVSAPVVAAAIAVVSMVGIVVFAKRRTVAE